MKDFYTCLGECGICDGSCERGWNHSEITLLGSPVTVGELKQLLEKYPDETSFGFRNAPLQILKEIKYPDVTFICFEL